jgi:hypothetical protein
MTNPSFMLVAVGAGTINGVFNVWSASLNQLLGPMCGARCSSGFSLEDVIIPHLLAGSPAKCATNAITLDPPPPPLCTMYRTLCYVATMQELHITGRKHVRPNDMRARLLGVDYNFALEDAIGSHACSVEASKRVTNSFPLGS